MSSLIRVDDKAVTAYVEIADDAPLPADGAMLVSLARWEQDAALIGQQSKPFAVRIPNTADIMRLDIALLAANAIVLEFPSFGDGRAYSQARLLREARGYQGELRARGAAVVRDQLLGMIRCGIDGFELRDDQSAQACLQALCEFSFAYQPALDHRPRVRQLRRGSATNAPTRI